MNLLFVKFFIVNISFACTMNPNISFILSNMTSNGRILQLIYKTNPFKDLLIHFEKIDILMIDYFSLKQKVISAKRIFFRDKITNSLLFETAMTQTSVNEDIKFIYNFKIKNNLQNISNCFEKLEAFIYGKFYIMKISFDENIIEPNDILKDIQFYTKIDAYLTICNKNHKDLFSNCDNLLENCNNDENLKSLKLMTLFIFGMFITQTIVIIMHYCAFKCSIRVYPVTENC